MSLKLVIGPANSAKAGAVLDAFRAQARRDPWLVVPTAADRAHYEGELVQDGCARAGTVATFGRFVREVATRAGYAARTIGPLQREQLVAEAIGAPAPGARADRPLARPARRGRRRSRPSWSGRSSTPQRLTAALRAWSGAPPALHEGAAIYDRYRARWSGSARVDADLFAWRALDALRARAAALGRHARLLLRLRRLHAAAARRGRDARRASPAPR